MQTYPKILSFILCLFPLKSCIIYKYSLCIILSFMLCGCFLARPDNLVLYTNEKIILPVAFIPNITGAMPNRSKEEKLKIAHLVMDSLKSRLSRNGWLASEELSKNQNVNIYFLYVLIDYYSEGDKWKYREIQNYNEKNLKYGKFRDYTPYCMNIRYRVYILKLIKDPITQYQPDKLFVSFNESNRTMDFDLEDLVSSCSFTIINSIDYIIKKQQTTSK